MRSRLVRGALLGLAVLGVASCGDGPGGLPGRSGALSVAPRFANAVSAGIVEVVAVRVRLARPGGGAIVLDTTVVFPVNSDEISLTLRAPISGDAEILQASFAMINAVGDTVFRAGPTDVTLRTAGAPAVATPTFQYSGTGANAVGVRFLAPPTIAYFGDTIDFDVEAFDGQSAGIAGTPIGFALADSADTVRARIPNRAEGRVVIGGQRGSVGIRAFTPADLGATHTLLIQPLASAIQAFAGNAQTGEAGAALAAPFTARVIAEDGLGVEGKEVVFSVTAGGGSLSVLVDTTDANGDAQTVLTLGAVPGAQQVTATATGVSGATTTFTATATAGAPAQLAITAEPTDGIAGAALTPLVVEIRDANGFVVTTANNPVTVALETDPSGVNPLGGTLMVAAVNGIATFSDLTLDVAAQGYVLNVTSAGLTSAIGTAFDVVPGAATVLEFQVQPPLTAGSGAPFAVSVRAMDALGNLATPFTGNVSMAIGANPSAGTLGGTLSIAAVAGVATFSDLEIDNLGDGYTLVATASGLGDATSNAFNIEPPGDVNAWINPAGGAWETASNWSRGTVPLGTDTVWIRQSGTYTVTVSTSRTIGKTLVGGSSGVQTLALTGGTLTIADTVQLGGTTELAISGGTVNGPGLLESDGAVVWSGGTFGAGLVLRSTPIGSFTLSGTAGRIINNIRIEILGAGLWTDTQMVGSGGGAVVHVGATGILDIQGDGSLLYNQGGALSVLENLGTVLRSTSPGIATVTANWVNNGSADIETGTLRLGGGGVSTTGIVNVGAGSTLDFSGGTKTLDAGTTITGDGIVLVSGGTLNVEGPWTLLGQVQLTGGTFRYSATGGTVSSLIASGGTLTGNATGFLTVADSMAWSAGTFGTGGGTTHVAAGASFDLRGTAARVFNNYIVEVAGTGTWRDVQSVNAGGGAEIRVLAGATLDVIGDGTFAFNQGGAQARLVNQGTITRHTSAGIVTVSASWDNDGVVDVQSGTLRLSGAGTSTTGSLDVAPGAVVDFSGGTKSLGGASSVTGAGRVLLSGGNVTANGPWGVTGVVEVSAGSLNYAAATGSVSGLIVSGGALNSAATGLLSVVDSMAWSAGNLGVGGGMTRVLAGGTFDLRGTAGRIMNSHTVEVAGAATWRDVQSINAGGGATIRILPGGTMDAIGDGSFLYNQGGAQARLVNEGTFTRSGSAGIVTVSAAWDNDGVADVLTGTLRLSGAGASTSGSLDVLAGATLDFSGGTKTFGATSSITGAGTVSVTGSTLTVNGPWAVTGLVQVSSGVLDYSAATGSVSGLVVTGGTLRGGPTGLLTVVDSMAWVGGTFGVGGGTARVQAGGTFDLRGTAGRVFNSYTVEIGGAGTWRDVQAINSGGGATIHVLAGGTLDILDDGNFAYNQGGAVARLVNEGTIVKQAGAGITSVGAAFDNDGLLSIESGTMSFTGGGTAVGGSYEALVGTELRFAGGTHTLDAATTLTVPGTVGVTSGTVTTTGVWALTGALTVSGGTLNYSAAGGGVGTLFLTGGTLGGAVGGVLTVSDSMVWTGGNLTGAGGSVLVADGALFEARGTAGRTMNNMTLEIAGTGVWRDTQVLGSGGNAVLRVAPTGSLDVQGDGSWAYNQGGGVSVLDVQGPLTRSTSAGTAVVSMSVAVAAPIDVQSGTLQFANGGTLAGSVDIAAGATLRLPSGTYTMQPGFATSGLGDLALAGATLSGLAAADTVPIERATLNAGALNPSAGGTVRVDSLLLWTGGALNGAGTVHLPLDGILMMSGTGGRNLNAGTLFIEGTAVIADAFTMSSGGGAAIHVAPSGVLSFAQPAASTANLSYNLGGGITTLLIEGDLVLSTDASAVTNMSFQMPGQTTVAAGTLNLTGSGTISGVIDNAANVLFNGATYTFTDAANLTGLGDFVIAGGTLNTSAASDTVDFSNLTITGGNLAQTGGFLIGDVVWEGGNLIGTGLTAVLGDLQMNGTAGRNFQNGVLEPRGTATYGGTFVMSTGSGARLRNLGSFDWAGDGTMAYNLGGGNSVFENLGSFVRNAATPANVATIGADFVDTLGSGFNVDGGTLRLSGSSSRIGGSPGLLGILETTAGTFSLQAGTTIGSDGGLLRMTGGTMTADAGATLNIPTFEMTGGTLSHAATLVFADGFAWGGGNITGAGGTTRIDGGTMVVTGAGRTLDAGHLLDVTAFGAVDFGMTGTLSTGGAAIIRNAGLFDLTGPATISYNLGGGASRFENLSGGTLRSSGATTGALNLAVWNAGGALEVAGDSLRLTAGSVTAFNGTATVDGSALVLAGGTFTLDGGLAVGGDGGDLVVRAGVLAVGANTLTVGGDLTTAGTGLLSMTDAASLVEVDGSATFGGASTAGQMTDGLLRLRGDFAQTGVSNSFRATGAHTTRFEGSLAQNILMSGAGSGGASSRFARVQLFNNNLPVTLELQSDVFAGWVEDSTASAQDVIGSAAGALFSVDTAFTLSNTLFDNVRLAVTGGGFATLQTLTFQNMDPTVTQLTVSLNAGQPVSLTSGTTFSTVPTSGRYVEAIQRTVGAPGILTVLAPVTPTTPGAFYLLTPNGASFPSIVWNGVTLP
ncbi:MAG: hypothetical protein KF709_11390 [Gemmatimonadaceae bacterium]|nr:hypothetical protein [Gemmatimonadaceae bacterium]